MSRGGRTSKIHVFVADVDLPMVHRVSPGSAADDPEGQKLMEQIPQAIGHDIPLTMDKAYEGDDVWYGASGSAKKQSDAAVGIR